MVGGSWRSGALALCFFVPAQLLEGQTPSFQMFDWGAAGGFDDQLQPLPCPALFCPVLPAPTVPTGWIPAWGGRLDGWLGWAGLGGWIEWKGVCVGVCGWIEGSTSGQEWSPAQRAPLFLTSSGKTRVGIGNARGLKDERKKETNQHGTCIAR